MSSQRRGSLLRYDCTITPPLTPVSNQRSTPPPLQSDPLEKSKQPKKRGRPPKPKANLGFSPTTTIDAYTPYTADRIASSPCAIDPQLLDITAFPNDNTASYFNSDSIEFNDINWTPLTPPLDTSLNAQQLPDPNPDFNSDVSFMDVHVAEAISPKTAVSQPQPQPQLQPQQVLDDYHVVSAMKAAILGTSDPTGTVSHPNPQPPASQSLTSVLMPDLKTSHPLSSPLASSNNAHASSPSSPRETSTATKSRSPSSPTPSTIVVAGSKSLGASSIGSRCSSL